MSFAGFPAELAISILLALITIFAIAVLIGLFGRRPLADTAPPMGDPDVTAFLFDGPNLLDATPNARQMIESVGGGHPGLEDVGRFLEPRFPGLLAQMQSSAPVTRVAGSEAAEDIAELERYGDSLRLTLRITSDVKTSPNALTLSAMRDELETLRHIGESAPQLIWKEDDSGTVTWANQAFLKIADRFRPPHPGLSSEWPPARLFPGPAGDPAKEESRSERLSLELVTEGVTLWFDVTRQPCPGGILCFAVPADAIVAAEAQSKLFVQTLTKTFADLSIGLAIFDRTRRLVMFNPALLDLTRLPVTFLSSRPGFSTLLDHLREVGILPEPKDYATWRDQVTALEAEAKEGTYCETWTLPTGEIYRVTGRPHPDGALAFLIEDISAEILLTRTFRAELETAHGVIDAMEEAVAVFSRTGQLIISNPRYDNDWASPEEGTTGPVLSREIAFWKSRAAPTPLWDKIGRLGGDAGERSEYEERISLMNGQLLRCRVVPLTGGATLVGFSLTQPDGLAQVDDVSNNPAPPDQSFQDSATG